MKELGKQVISLLLVLLTFISCISPIEIAKAQTSGQGTYNGSGNTSYNSKGTYYGKRSGIRVYIIDRDGNRVSNIADIANKPSMSGDLDIVVCDTGRTEELSYHYKHLPSGHEIYQMDIEGPLKHWVANPGNIVAQSPEVPYDSNGDGSLDASYKNKSNYSYLVPVVSGDILQGEKERARGKQIGDYFTGAEKLQPQLAMMGGGGSGEGSTEAETPPSNNGIIAESLAEQLVQIEDRLTNNYKIYKEQYEKGAFSKIKVRDMILDEAKLITSKIVEANVYNQDDIDVIGGKIKDILATIEADLNNLPEIEIDNEKNGSESKTGSDKQNQEDDSLSKSEKSVNIWSLVNELYDTAYATDNSGTEKEFKPIYRDEKLSLLLNAEWYGISLFYIQWEKKIYDKNGDIDVIQSLAANDYVIMMEPIMWNRLQDSKGYRSKFIFYGTPYNLGQFMAEQASIGGWDDGNGTGGWIGSGTNKSIPWSMYTDADLELNGYTITAGSKSSLVDKKLTNEQLGTRTIGHSLHFYEFGMPDGLPSIPTYDIFVKDPNPEPHPAPDPDPNDPGNIPLTPAEDPEKYKELTRNVNIVKTYQIEHLDGTIEHVETFTRTNTPQTIFIKQEPDYKVVEWFTSTDYYFEVHPSEEVSPTEWDVMKGTMINTDGGETTYEESQKIEVNNDVFPVAKISSACDCEEKDSIDGEHGKHAHDNTLYVRLIKKERIPETSTFDEPDHQPSGTPPAVPPHPSQDPHEPEGPNFDPETDHVEENNRFCHYRIVKVYETITVTDEGEQPPESDGVFVTYKTNPIVQIEDEAQSSDPFDGSWHLKDWCVSDTYNNVPPPDLWKPITDPLPKKQSGTGETKVDLIDKNDTEKEVTLYVHLVRKLKEGNPTGAIIIQQSQISKTIHTNDSHIGGYFGNYTFQFYEGAFKKNHTTYFDHCCIGGDHRYHSCRCKGHICAHEMPGSDGDDKLDFAFDLMSGQDELEIKKGIHSDIDPKVYGKGGSAFGALKDGNYLHYPKTLTSLSREDFTFPGDGNDGEGAEYVTILWRGTSKYKDIPTLALYKKKDITEVYGADNYTISDKLLSSVGSTANRKSNKKRASQYWVGDLKFTFGLEGHGDRSDRLGISSCINIGGNQCIDYDPKYVGTYDQFTYDFEAGVAIRFYAGKQIGLQAAPFGSKSTTPILEDQIGKHKERNVIQCKQEIKFYPYIRMTYMLNKLKDAEDEEANTDAAGYVNDVRKDTYVLSEHESSVLPSDAVIVQWEKGRNDENLLLTSQQWSVHQKAVSGSDGWQGKNQVLPGGAIYQLSTPKEDWVTVNLITYQTIVDDKARNEYLTASNTLTGDEYKVKKVAEDHLSFVNDAKEVLDNLKVVQWVNKNVGASTAWTNDFVAKPSNGIVKILDGIEISSIDLSGLRGGSKTHPNDDTKYYMRQQTQLSNYQEVKKLSEWTKTIDDAQGIKEQPFEGDLDVFNVRHKNTVYKLFTDTSGNVYLAKLEKIYSANDTAMDSTETDIQNMVDAMKDLNGDTLSTKTGGATITKLCDKTVAGTAINGILTGDAKEIDDATFFITNFVSALNRNKGTDYTAEWVDGPTEGKWYNDAFDGVYLARQQTTFNVGFAFSASRVSALDPALDPQNKGQSDLYTSAFLSQFCVDSQSEAAIAQGKVKNYIGTFKDVDITMPDMESMYISKKFYIPNANVQDLN